VEFVLQQSLPGRDKCNATKGAHLTSAALHAVNRSFEFVGWCCTAIFSLACQLRMKAAQLARQRRKDISHG
jgi:hypothetical protein